MFNILIQIFASGATGFQVYTDYGTYDMDIWLAFRRAIALLAPYEDIICDGQPAPVELLSVQAPDSAFVVSVVSAMEHASSHAMLIASSTQPYGSPTTFSVRSSHADDSWLLCDLESGRSVPVDATNRTAEWRAEAEGGSVLLFGSKTPCHQLSQ